MKVKTDTIARTICLAIALFNQILAVAGKGQLSFTEDNIYQAVTIGATIVTTIIAWWKNNSFTQEALKADEMMLELKRGDSHDGN